MNDPTIFQLASFLANYTPKSPLDAQFIKSYLASRGVKSTRRPLRVSTIASNPLDVQSFISWLKTPYRAVSAARFQNSLVILGDCFLSSSHIIGLLRDGTVLPCDILADHAELFPASPEETTAFLEAMWRSGWQVDERTLALVPKHIPNPDEKIIFHSHDQSIIGLGVVRSVDMETGSIVLYCYYTYPSSNSPGPLGYSMNEAGIVNLRDYVFEDMLAERNSVLGLNGVSCLRRLNRELERHGKIWKDKLKRIEPLQPKSPLGERYWYITDKMQIGMSREKNTPTSHFRYLAGNYFVTEEAAVVMRRKWLDDVHGYLAGDGWPGK